MALQINTGLTTQDGGAVASGSYAIFTTRFPPRGLKFNVSIELYRSLAALEGGFSEIKVNEIAKQSFTKELTAEEFSALTPIIIHEHVKAFLEESVGEGNVSVIL